MTTEPGRIRVAIVDDHPVVRDGMAALLREYPEIEITGTAASLGLAEPLLDSTLVDVLLLDIRLGEETGFQLLERHRDAARRPAVVVLTAFAQAEYAAAAYRLGAAALVVKTAPMHELVAAIRSAALGGSAVAQPGRRATNPTLTTREQQVVRLVVEGRSNDEIGAALGIATKTVEGHLRRVFEPSASTRGRSCRREQSRRGGSRFRPSPAAEGSDHREQRQPVTPAQAQSDRPVPNWRSPASPRPGMM